MKFFLDGFVGKKSRPLIVSMANFPMKGVVCSKSVLSQFITQSCETFFCDNLVDENRSGPPSNHMAMAIYTSLSKDQGFL